MNAKNERPAQPQKEQTNLLNANLRSVTMTSREIAEITNKRHTEVLRSIRNMEPAWEKVSGRKFASANYVDEQGKARPIFELTKLECLYVSTKYNDEARAKLVIRWEELEHRNHSTEKGQITEKASPYQENVVITVKMGEKTNQIYVSDGVIYAKASPIMRYLGYTNGISGQYVNRIGQQYFKQIKIGLQEAWFVNIGGFNELMKITLIPISSSVLISIYRDVFGIDSPEKELPFTYRFTDGDMLEVFNELLKSPVNKLNVQRLLLNGKK
jgi:phage regulator Rha-like protein